MCIMDLLATGGWPDKLNPHIKQVDMTIRMKFCKEDVCRLKVFWIIIALWQPRKKTKRKNDDLLGKETILVVLPE